jgi:PAS domain S-box-containing protein
MESLPPIESAPGATSPRVRPRRAAALAAAGLLAAAVGAAGRAFGRARSTRSRNEDRFRLLAENARDLIYRYRLLPEGKRGFEYVSPSAEALTGYSPEEFLADPDLAVRLVHDDDAPLLKNSLDSPDETVVLRVRCRDGRWLCAELRHRPVRDRAGRVVAVEGIARDVTERQRAEEELRVAEARLRAAFEEAPVGMALVRLDGSYFQVNRALCEILGYSEEELTDGRTWAALTHPDDLERSREFVESTLSGHFDSYHLEKRYVRANGKPVCVSLNVSLVRDETGAPKHFVAKVQDVTRERRYKDALERLSHQNELILASAGEGIFGLDREGRATFVNPAGARMIGHDPKEMVGRVMHDVCHHTRPDGTPYPGEECPIHRSARDGEAFSVSDEVFWRADGTSFPVEYESTCIEEDGEVVGAVVTFRDVTERRRAEEALRESEERYRLLVDLSPDAIAIYADGRFLYGNRAVEDLIGVAPEELVGQPVMSVVHPDYREAVAERVRLVEEEGQKLDLFAQKLVRPDGRVIDVEVVSAPVTFHGRRATQAVVRDVTERKRSERALRESEERYRLVARATNEVIWDSDLRTGDMRWAGATEAMFGYAPEDVQGGTWWEEHLHPDDRERVVEGIEAAIEGGEEVWSDEYRFRRRDGSYALVVDRCFVVREGPQDEAVRVVGSMRDVSEERRAEEALRRSEERFRLLAENTSDLVCLHQPNGRYLYVSPSCRRLLGYEPRELLGRDPYTLFHPDDAERIRNEAHEAALRGTKSISITYRLRKKSGEYVWLETATEPILDESGRVVRLQTSSRDVSERKRAEEALAEAARTRADFLADVSHELRTPLTIIRGNAEVALGLQKDGVHASFLEEILGEAGSMGRLIEDLLLLARSESVEAPFDLRRISAGDFLAALKSHAEVLACRMGAKLEARLRGEGALLADPTRLEQAVLALVDNAAKYGPRGGTVVLHSEVVPSGSPDEPDLLRIEVRDDGPGIPRKDLPHVFERFYRSGMVRRTGEAGTGLGLAIVKSVVEAHDGIIEAESREGAGTTMRIELPLRPKGPER